jgi:hypothetical protein
MLGWQIAMKFGLKPPIETFITSVNTDVATTPNKKKSRSLKKRVKIYI